MANLLKRCRLNTPRIREIEDQIAVLLSELAELVNPGEEDYVNAYEAIRDMGTDGIDVSDAIYCALESRDSVIQEAMDHMRHGRDLEAAQLLEEADIVVTLDEIRNTTEFTGS